VRNRVSATQEQWGRLNSSEHEALKITSVEYKLNYHCPLLSYTYTFIFSIWSEDEE